MKHEALIFLAGVGCGLLIAVICGMPFIATYQETIMRATKYGVAYYHPQTGVFTWRDGEEEAGK
jgi:hypothetical protein